MFHSLSSQFIKTKSTPAKNEKGEREIEKRNPNLTGCGLTKILAK